MLNEDSRELLKKITSLPDLLAMSKAESGEDFYRFQDVLRGKYAQSNLPYKWTMPLRHLYTCSTKDHTFGEVLYKLSSPTMSATESASYEIEIREGEIHEVMEHGAELDDGYKEFLSRIPSDAA